MDYDFIVIDRCDEEDMPEDDDGNELPYNVLAYKDVVAGKDPLWTADVASVRVYGAQVDFESRMNIDIRPWHEVEFTGTTSGPRFELKDGRSG